MRTNFTGPAPTWLGGVDERALRARFGRQTFARGLSYASAQAVSRIESDRGGAELHAVVDGSSARAYRTVISAPRNGAVPGGRCTCPVGLNCKHVVAVLLTARRWSRPADRQPGTGVGSARLVRAVPRNRWEQTVAALVSAGAPAGSGDGGGTPLALQVDLVVARAGAVPRLRMRPMAQGKKGWVKAGAAWRDLERPVYYGHGRGIDSAQREWFREVLARLRAREPYLNSYGEPTVYLDALGPGIWPLLDRAAGLDIALTGPSADSEVRLASEPARSELDLRRRPAGVELSGQVVLGDGTPVVGGWKQATPPEPGIGGGTFPGQPPPGGRYGWVAPPGGRGADRFTGYGPDGRDELDALVDGSWDGAPVDEEFWEEEFWEEASWKDAWPAGAAQRSPHAAGPDAELLLLGRPPHGFAVVRDQDLLLVPLDRPLDPGVEALLARPPVLIPDPELPRFLTTYYPALRRQVCVGSADGSVELPEIGPPRLTLDVEFEPGHATTLTWGVVYRIGREDAHYPFEGRADEPARDPAAETALVAGLNVLDAVPGLRWLDGARYRLAASVRLRGLDTAAFVEHVLPGLQADESIELTVRGRPAAYSEALGAPAIVVSAGDTTERDWFDLFVTVTVDGQEVPFAELFSALALGEERLLLDSGTWFRLDRPELRRLRELIDEARALQDREREGLRLSPIQAGLWAELVALGVVGQQSERWRRRVGALLGLDEIARPDPPVGLAAQLRPYQLDGYQWLSLLWDLQLGGVLADDMGLGKTVQTLAMAVRAAEQGTLGGDAGPLLIVAPASVLSTWAGQAATFAPGLRVGVITETEARSNRSVSEVAAGCELVVTSYTLFRLDEHAYQAVRWCGLVLDEAQFVKNHQAKTYQCARRLDTPFKLAITGTPLENSLMDLWSMLSIAAPGLFPDPRRFDEFYRRPIEGGTAPERLDALRRRVRPLMLRRTKEQVAADLPAKTEQLLEVNLDARHRRIYETHLNRERARVLRLVKDLDRNRIAILRSLTLLRQLSLDASLIDERHAGRVPSSKIDALVEQLAEIAAEGHRALVFSQFTRFLARVRDRLDREGIGYCYLDGRTRDRARRVAQFTEGDAPAFLISLKAGGFGLNLTAADYVFVLDPWWNPAVEEQAIDRTHRIGQDKPVMVYRLISADTIEQKVIALQQRKRDLFARVVDGGAAASGALTAEDIRGLFAS